MLETWYVLVTRLQYNRSIYCIKNIIGGSKIFRLLILLHKRTEIRGTTFLYMPSGSGTETPLTLPQPPVSENLMSPNVKKNAKHEANFL